MIVGADVMFAITTERDAISNNPIAIKNVLFILFYPLCVLSSYTI